MINIIYGIHALYSRNIQPVHIKQLFQFGKTIQIIHLIYYNKQFIIA